MSLHAAAMALLAAGAAGAQGIEADDSVVTAVEAGIYCLDDTGERRAAPGTVAGYTNIYSEIELRARTFVVPVAEGVTFGFRAQAAEGLMGEMVSSVHHPPFRGIGATDQILEGSLTPDGGWSGLYTFDHDYEMVTGTWRFETIVDGRPVLSATFEMVPAAEAPQFVGLCAGPPQISRGPDPQPDDEGAASVAPTPRPS